MFQPKFSCLRAARISRFFRVNCKLVACKTTFFFRICNLTVMMWTVMRNYKKGKRLTRGSHFIFARVWGMRLAVSYNPSKPSKRWGLIFEEWTLKRVLVFVCLTLINRKRSEIYGNTPRAENRGEVFFQLIDSFEMVRDLKYL